MDTLSSLEVEGGVGTWEWRGGDKQGWCAVDTQSERRNSRQWERESCRSAVTGAGWEWGPGAWPVGIHNNYWRRINQRGEVG